MSKPQIGSYEHGLKTPERYAVSHVPKRGWRVSRGIGMVTPFGSVLPETLAEAMDAAYADAANRAALEPTC